MLNRAKNWTRDYALWAVYFFVWAGFLGSLFFSQIMKLPPCSLCIIQRGLLYPLILIMAVGFWTRDRLLPFYILPFSILGLIVSGYHNLLVWHLAPADLIVCSVQLPCTVKDFTLWGFITIPLMSFVAFLLTTLWTLAHIKLAPKD